ncbi:uncharacterized protein LOC116256278 [Nymphaea colorata]|nr:uncharacterized protein LOC116256278 [Nymphaea colorata]
MEGRSPVIAGKRLWHIIRAVMYMLRKGLSKQKVLLDLHLMMKRGKLAGKAIGNLMFHRYSSLSCRSDGISVAAYAPNEYEFSCSNTPAHFFPFQRHDKRKHHHQHRRNGSLSCIYPDSSDHKFAASFQKALEILNSDLSGKETPTPLSPTLCGLSPMASPRPLRVTDSPFPLKEEEDDDHRIDREAEEFIARFYEQLRSQRQTAILEAR